MVISQAHWDELVAHARDDAPNECCGYARARDGRVEEVFRSENLRASPYGYELDPRSLLAANELDDEGHEVVIYHSHPKSPAEPSQTDINLAHYPHWRYVIVSLADEPSVRCWRIVDGRVRKRTSPSSDETLVCPACGRVHDDPGDRFCADCGMPLVRAGEGDGLEPARDEHHERARKIRPELTRGPLVRVAGGRNQAEAELIQNILLEEGVPSILRRTAGFDVHDMLAAGPRDVMVAESAALVARDALFAAGIAPAAAVAGIERGQALRITLAVVAGAALAALIAWALIQLS